MATQLILACVKIFFVRILDVSLGSVRTILIVKEKTVLAAVISFFETFIWFVIVKDAIRFDGPIIPLAVAYAGGFACGTYVGGKIAKRFVSGHVSVHVVTSRRDEDMLRAIRENGYAITVMNVNSSEFGKKKHMILADIDKNNLPAFETLVKELDEEAFIIVMETKSVLGGSACRQFSNGK